MQARLSAAALLAALAAAGCNLFGNEVAEAATARREADGKAIGGACRHAGRAIEDCYLLNRRADKSAVYAGWREMNDYMRENKLEPVVPQLSAETLAQANDGEARKGARGGDPPAEKAPDRTDKALKAQGEFFNRLRDLTGSAFFSSKMGVHDLGYMGNVPNPNWQGAPKAALDELGVSYAEWDKKYGNLK